MTGRLIVIEGADGVGKSTLAAGLARALCAVHLATPGAPVAGVRATVHRAWAHAPEAVQLFYAASVLAASREAEPWLARGTDVVVDRYLLSTLAYARARGGCLALHEVAARVRPADLTLFLHLGAVTRRERLDLRGPSTQDLEAQAALFSLLLDEAWEDLLRHHGHVGRAVRLDVSGLDRAQVLRDALVASGPPGVALPQLPLA